MISFLLQSCTVLAADQAVARRYATQPIGDFVIALNGAADATLLWEVPPSVVGSDALDLISGTKHCGIGTTLPIGASTAVVLLRIQCS